MKLRDLLKKLLRYPLTHRMRRRLKRRDFLLLSSACMGGALLHDLGLPFETPTINLTVLEFDRFCSDVEGYLSRTPTETDRGDYPFPVAKLGDVTILCNHYKDFDEFLAAWQRRTERFFARRSEGWEILLMATDYQLREPGAKERFHALPYRKVCFSKQECEYPEFIRVPEYGGRSRFADLVKVIDWQGHRVFEKAMDCVAFLNGDGEDADRRR